MTTTLRRHRDTPGLSGLRSRRCVVSGEVYPQGRLLRFVIAPDGAVMPDIEGKLPGRGIWVKADREAVDAAVRKRLFARAAGSDVKADTGLSGRVEVLLVQKLVSLVGLARRAGRLILGFDQVERALRSEVPPAVIIDARDASPLGTGKLKTAALARGIAPFVIGALTNEELSLAAGRENVVHAALKAGHLAERMIFEATRLEGFRPIRTWNWPGYREPAAVGAMSAPVAAGCRKGKDEAHE